MRQIVLAKCGEVVLKGQNRPIFEAKLVSNIKNVCGELPVKVEKAQATIYVKPLEDSVDMEDLAERVARVFGITTVCVANCVEKELSAICKLAAEMMKGKSGTFKAEARRSDKKFPYRSPEICGAVGEAVLEANPSLTVDVREPDTVLMVEVRDFGAYLYADKITGAGGMPLGTSGRATLLLSGGIDSPVAGYMIAKRGVKLNLLHFYSYPYTSERAKEKVIELAQLLARYCGRMNLHIVPFTDIQLAIHEKCPEEQMTVIMRRIMMYIANRVAARTGSGAIVTGESVGQVASQTLEALAVTDDAADLPVLRPVIGMDKEEIVRIARKIDTYETSILPYEDCCTVFTPKHPNTKPVLEKILKSESHLDMERLLDEAVEGIETIRIRPEV